MCWQAATYCLFLVGALQLTLQALRQVTVDAVLTGHKLSARTAVSEVR